MVERGEGLKPLKYGNGEFIYKEKDRHLAGRGPLSLDEAEERKARLEIEHAAEQEALMSIIPTILVVVAAALAGILVSGWAGFGVLTLGFIALGHVKSTLLVLVAAALVSF